MNKYYIPVSISQLATSMCNSYMYLPVYNALTESTSAVQCRMLVPAIRAVRVRTSTVYFSSFPDSSEVLSRISYSCCTESVMLDPEHAVLMLVAPACGGTWSQLRSISAAR